jgi:hypothetical protein
LELVRKDTLVLEIPKVERDEGSDNEAPKKQKTNDFRDQ